ncbi:MAG: carbohydrate kinase family protein [Parvibaculaceae bacterium]
MRALTIGSAMIDIIVLVDSRNVERMTMTNENASFLLLEQGAKVEAHAISSHCGGGAVNTAVALKRLGSRVAALAKTGRDGNAKRVRTFLEAEGVETGRLLDTDELATGQAVMVSSHDRNATIFTHRGANGLIRPSDLPASLFKGLELVYVSGLSNRSSDCFPGLMKVAIGAGAFVASNPGIRQITSRTEALLTSIAGLGLMSVNRKEANALVPAMSARASGRKARKARGAREKDVPRLMRIGLSFGGFDMGLVEFADTLLSTTGLKRLVITDGSEGAILADAKGFHHCPILKVEVMGTAGAGDAFSSTLSFMLASGAEPQDALRAASINAASVVTHADTTEGLLDLETLKNRAAAAQKELPVGTWPWKT